MYGSLIECEWLHDSQTKTCRNSAPSPKCEPEKTEAQPTEPIKNEDETVFNSSKCEFSVAETNMLAKDLKFVPTR